MTDALHAFLPGPRCTIAGQPDGPLSGLSFAVKDLIDVAGVPTAGGTPDWPATRPVPTQHAWVVQRLLDSGASVIGKTITDEVSLGILGENAHDGTPLNPAAPGRVPGGSSSGSASAVAGGACDFALGTDTGGSVRVPASFCGLYGIRPTHGRLDFTGITVQAPDSDTVGWFAPRRRVVRPRWRGAVRRPPAPPRCPRGCSSPSDAFGFADPAVAEALQPLVKPPRGPAGPPHRGGDGPARPVSMAARATHPAIQPVLADLRPVARSQQSAARLQRGARTCHRLDDHRHRAHPRRADADGGAGRGCGFCWRRAPSCACPPRLFQRRCAACRSAPWRCRGSGFPA